MKNIVEVAVVRWTFLFVVTGLMLLASGGSETGALTTGPDWEIKDVTDEVLPGMPSVPKTPAVRFAVTADGRSVVVGIHSAQHAGSSAFVYDTVRHTATAIAIPAAGTFSVDGVGISDNGEVVALAGRDDQFNVPEAEDCTDCWDGFLYVFRSDGTLLWQDQLPAASVDVSPDGKYVVVEVGSCTEGRCEWRLYETSGGLVCSGKATGYGGRIVQISPDGSLFATGWGLRTIPSCLTVNGVRRTGRAGGVFSSNARFVGGESEDRKHGGSFEVSPLAGENLLTARPLWLAAGCCSENYFVADNGSIAACCTEYYDGTGRLAWRTGEEVFVKAISPDGKWVLGMKRDGWRVSLYDGETGAIRYSYPGPSAGGGAAYAFTRPKGVDFFVLLSNLGLRVLRVTHGDTSPPALAGPPPP